MTKKDDLRHTIKFILVEPRADIDDSHKGSHYLGIIPAKGRKLAAYLVYAVHRGKSGPTKKKYR